MSTPASEVQTMTQAAKVQKLTEKFEKNQLNNAKGAALAQDTSMDAFLAGNSNGGGAMYKARMAYEAQVQQTAKAPESNPKPAIVVSLSLKERMQRFS